MITPAGKPACWWCCSRTWPAWFTATLRQRGWRGVVAVEVLSAELRRLPVAEFARRGYQATVRYWS